MEKSGNLIPSLIFYGDYDLKAAGGMRGGNICSKDVTAILLIMICRRMVCSLSKTAGESSVPGGHIADWIDMTIFFQRY